jgi:hypothetical protein
MLKIRRLRGKRERSYLGFKKKYYKMRARLGSFK